MPGTFILSFDCEMEWGFDSLGMCELNTPHQCLDYLSRAVFLLNLIEDYKIPSTWAFVGAMAFEDKAKLKDFLLENNKSTYDGVEYKLPSCFYKYKKSQRFSLDFITKLESSSFVEIASHSFGHFYTECLPDKASEYITMDLTFWKNRVVNDLHYKYKGSFIFPKNQVDIPRFPLYKKLGVKCVRSNLCWFDPKGGSSYVIENVKRILRVIDSFFILKNLNKSLVTECKGLTVTPATDFFRFYNNKYLMRWHLNRIKRAIKKSGKGGLDYHLWFHPHNFNHNKLKNVESLIELFQYINILKKDRLIELKTMSELNGK